jgi:hypothetical protein
MTRIRLTDLTPSAQARARQKIAESMPVVKEPEWSPLYENPSIRPISNPVAKRNPRPALAENPRGKKEGMGRTRVRFTGFRVRPLDPDNFAGSVKDLLDGVKHAGLIPGDEPWRIILETDQVQVATFKEERTEIEIITPTP